MRDIAAFSDHVEQEVWERERRGYHAVLNPFSHLTDQDEVRRVRETVRRNPFTL